MTTLPYNLGETTTLGFAVDQADGTPMPLDGLQLRVVVFLTGADLVIPAYAVADYVVPPGETEQVWHPSIISFDLTPENFQLLPRLWPCAPEINDGTGWRQLPGPDHFIKAWRR
ncbi:hypothetical protein [Paracoccus aminovorans]|uniref:hypothetical protein n=1 Tax=Paracoccus aminovorans TaxID=34004 RepID=UPI000780BCF3|nr:hypothetical protein [Paracoccus aminovorans]